MTAWHVHDWRQYSDVWVRCLICLGFELAENVRHRREPIADEEEWHPFISKNRFRRSVEIVHPSEVMR